MPARERNRTRACSRSTTALSAGGFSLLKWASPYQVPWRSNLPKAHYGDSLAGRTLALWGLAFKPRTDDVREAPALVLIDALLAAGVHCRVHDPEAMPNVRAQYGDKLVYCDRPYGVLEGADGLVIVTEWAEFRHPDFEVMRRLLKEPVVFDGRNLYEPAQMEGLGFTYYAIGRGRRG